MAELAVVLPMEALVAGVRGGLVVQTWDPVYELTKAGEASPGPTVSPMGSVSAEAGVNAARQRSLGWRAGVSARWTRVPGHVAASIPPGLLLCCAQVESIADDAFASGPWIAATRRDPRAASGVGIGLRLVVERAVGKVELPPDMVWPSEPWSAWGARLHVDLAWSPPSPD